MTPNYLDGNWHDWHGGECPVPGEMVVAVCFHHDDHEVFGCAREFGWTTTDITAFRVIRDEPSTSPQFSSQQTSPYEYAKLVQRGDELSHRARIAKEQRAAWAKDFMQMMLPTGRPAGLGSIEAVNDLAVISVAAVDALIAALAKEATND